jgi:hypothetical protein
MSQPPDSAALKLGLGLPASAKPEAFPRVLLVTHGNPRSNGAAELFLRALASHYPAGRLERFDLVDAPEPSWIESTWLGHPSSGQAVKFSALPLLSSYHQREFVRKGRSEAVGKIRETVERSGIERLWVVLNSGYTIHLTEALLQVVRVPIVITVWDTPEYFIRNQRMDSFTGARLLRSFQAVFCAAAGRAVASEGMRNIYRDRWDRDSVILHQGVEPAHWREPRAPGELTQPATIAFAGSLYSKTEWNAFIRAIEILRSGPAAKEITVDFVGRFPRLGARRPGFVREVGQVQYEAALDIVSRADVAYLPYWMNRSHAYFARTAFPSKLSAYAAAGAPVFVHSPAGSSPAEFMRRFPMGVHCASIDPTIIAGELHRLLFDVELRQRASVARRQALEKELGTDAVLGRLGTLLR